MEMTKALLEELVKVTGVKRGRKQNHEQHVKALVTAVGALDDAAYDEVSDDVADWYDAAVEAINAGEEIPGAAQDPNEEAEEEAPKTRGNRRNRNSQSETDEQETPKMKKTLVAIALAEVVKGITLTVTCGEDVFEGEVTKVTAKGRGKNKTVSEFTLKTGEGDEVFGADDLLFDEGDKLERHDEVAEEEKPKTTRGRRGAKKEEAEEAPKGRRGRGAAKKEEKPAEPLREDIEFGAIAEGDVLELQVEDDTFTGTVAKVTKKGRGKAAKVVEFTLTTADGEEVFEADHIVVEEGDKIVKVTTPEAGEAAKEEAPKGRGRGRGAKKPAGESAASQVRKLICENLDADKKEVEALLAENNIDMKPSTFDVLFSEAHNLISVLRELDMLA